MKNIMLYHSFAPELKLPIIIKKIVPVLNLTASKSSVIQLVLS